MDATHLVLLQKLSDGGRFNVLHSTARALIAEGLAREEFGRLTITEAGRLAINPRKSIHVISEHITDLNFGCHLSDDPMSNPQREPFELLPEAPPLPQEPRPQEAALTELMPLPAPPEPLAPTSDRRELALRAAGVASGKTGVWVDEKWVVAFIEAFDQTSQT
jgi:hypothetical protein